MGPWQAGVNGASRGGGSLDALPSGCDMRPTGRLAQPVERFVYTEDAGGSNPSPPTTTDL